MTKQYDPFGFVKAIQVPKDKKTVDKVHKLLFKKKKDKWDEIWMPHLSKKDLEEAEKLALHKKHYPFGDD